METNQTSEPIKMCDAALIEDMKLAVDTERLPTEFTLADIKEWMKNDQVKKLDGTPYPELSLELLANYSLYTPITKKRKQKVLYMNAKGSLFSFNPFKPA